MIAWTTDGYWAAVIVGVLDGAEEGDLSFSATVHGAAEKPVRPRLDRHERKSPAVGCQTRLGRKERCR